MATTIQRPPSAQPADYRRLVVQKPWGHEFLCFQNSRCAVWCLHLDPDASTSLHAHPGKETALFLFEGAGDLHGLDRRLRVAPRDIVEIDAGVFHRFEAGRGGARLLEFESPPVKTDLVRLEDPNGRLDRGIEGRASVVTQGLSAWGHFQLADNTVPGAQLTQPESLGGRPFFALATSSPCRVRFESANLHGPVLALETAG